MSTRKAFLMPALSFAVAAFTALALWLGIAPAQAADPIFTTVVNVTGTVNDNPESVSFGGQATVSSRLARDPDIGAPSLILLIDMSGVSGLGSQSRKQYEVPVPEYVQRRHAANQFVEITFPYLQTGSNIESAKSAVASFNLTVDLDTGAITQASATVSTSRF
jgi:hypothetical protein